jgi:hypothetical protein
MSKLFIVCQRYSLPSSTVVVVCRESLSLLRVVVVVASRCCESLSLSRVVVVSRCRSPCQRARERRGQVGWWVPARELAGVVVMVGETNPNAFSMLED